MSVDTSTSITRKLRKLYAVTQKNMDLLDRAIVESFVENFPTESTRIHMGRVAPVAPPAPARQRGAAKSKKKPVRGKVKIKPKKGKGKPAAKGRKKGTIGEFMIMCRDFFFFFWWATDAVICGIFPFKVQVFLEGHFDLMNSTN